MKAMKGSLASFTHTRVASVPAAELASLRAWRTAALIDQLEHLEQTLSLLGPAVADELHGCVPKAADAPLRRALLTAKRDVHNGRALRLRTAELTAVRALLAGDAYQRLSSFAAASAERSRLERLQETVLASDLVTAAATLSRHLSEPRMNRALALASPSFAAALERQPPALTKPSASLARTATAYVTRAAVKPSPFSSLAGVGLAGAGTVAATSVRIAPALAYELLIALVLDADGDAEVELEPLEVSKPTEGRRPRAVCGTRITNGDYFFRIDRSVDVTVYNEILDVCRSVGRAPTGSHLAALATLDPHSDPGKTLARLLRLGLLRPVAPWSADECPFAAIGRILSRVGKNQAAAAMGRIPGRIEAFKSEGARAELISELRSDARAAFAGLNAPVPAWLDHSVLVHENVSADVAVPGPTDDVIADLHSVMEYVAPRIGRSCVNFNLTRKFVERFGAGGFCDDLNGFLHEICSTPEFDATLARWSFQDVVDHATGHEPAAAAVAPSVAAFFQLAARSHSAFESGDYMLVLNGATGGAPAIATKYLDLLPEGGLRPDVAAWLDSLHGTKPWYSIGIGEEWSELTATTWSPRPSLRWPGDLPGKDDADQLTLDELGCRHMIGSDMLQLETRQGPIGLTYLGLAPVYLQSGPLRLLLTIADPWIIRTNLDDIGVRIGEGPPKAVEYFPRRTCGRVVVRRAAWRMPIDAFPMRRQPESSFDYLRRVRAWQQALKLPDELFLRMDAGRLELDPRRRKPVWLRLDSPHALASATARIEQGGHTVVLTEALPTAEEHWVRDHDGATRAAEYVAYMAWPASTGQADARAIAVAGHGFRQVARG
jgi:Lantibiotic dehydratase, N terminus